MQKKYSFWINLIFLRKKADFLAVFSAFYGQRSVTAAWATLSMEYFVHSQKDIFETMMNLGNMTLEKVCTRLKLFGPGLISNYK